MKQLTLVSFYGPKNTAFVEYMDALHSEIKKSELAAWYRPYDIDQIHGTLIGLEKLVGFQEHFNRNIWEKDGLKRLMQTDCILEIIERYLEETIIRMGGIQKGTSAFHSWGRDPYDRMFNIQADRLNINGWPYTAQADEVRCAESLVDLRSAFYQQANIQHKYHQQKDNDFYMVLGRLDFKGLSAREIETTCKPAMRALKKTITEKMSTKLLELKLAIDNTFLVQYEDKDLNRRRSKSWNIEVLRSNPDFIQQLYDDRMPKLIPEEQHAIG
ncbi:MAG: hypothetical protein AAF990_07180 [Bacteroidota bacterium]